MRVVIITTGNMIYVLLQMASLILQCFDAVGWAAGRASGL